MMMMKKKMMGFSLPWPKFRMMSVELSATSTAPAAVFNIEGAYLVNR